MSLLLNFWFIIVAFFALGFSIFIHELGHFLAARKRGLIADRFSIGFGPRILGWKRNGTDYRISLFPLGGYVSLPQLADMGRLEGGEGDEASKLPPISYTDKMIVAVMGAVFNLIFAFVISLILWGVGRDIVKSTEVQAVSQEVITSEGKLVPGPAYIAGIRTGDRIVTVDGYKVPDWMQLQNAFMTSTGRTEDGRPVVEVEVLRDEETLDLTVYPVLTSSEAIRSIGVDPSKLLVTEVDPEMPAGKAGLEAGDVILKLDGEDASSSFLQRYLAKNGDREIAITVERDGEELVIPITPAVKPGETSPRFGFGYFYDVEFEKVHLNPIDQIGIMVHTMKTTLIALIHRGSDVKVRNMSGPVGIVHGLSTMAKIGWIDLIWFLALINVNLALFNLLPIPVLDGGHMLFATISKIIGRQLPRRFMENLQGGFVITLLCFVAYVTFFDVGRVGRDIGIINDEPTLIIPEAEETPETNTPETAK